jgi:hypothetical protein
MKKRKTMVEKIKSGEMMMTGMAIVKKKKKK